MDDKYVTRSEYDSLKSLYDKIMERLDSVVISSPEVEQNSKPKPKGRGGNENGESDI